LSANGFRGVREHYTAAHMADKVLEAYNESVISSNRGFNPGDDLVFQLESGFGLLRVLAVEGEGAETVWHLLAYDEFFPDVESAELALAEHLLYRCANHTWRSRTAPSNARQPRDSATARY
jgi:hypothetical protein